MVEMLLPSKVTAAMQTTATRDSSRPYSTNEAPSSSRMNLVEAARSSVIEISRDGVDRVRGNKTPPTAQILPARVLSRPEMLVPSKVTAAMQTTASRDSSRPYSTKDAPSSSRTNLVWAAKNLVMERSPGQGLERSANSLAGRSGSPPTGRPVQLVGTLQVLVKQHPCRSSPCGAPNCERTCLSCQVGSELLVAAQLRSSELKGIASRAIFFVNDSCGGRHAECKRRLTPPCTRRRLAPRIVDTERPFPVATKRPGLEGVQAFDPAPAISHRSRNTNQRYKARSA